MNQSDFQLAKTAMNFAAAAGRISVADCDRLLAEIDPAVIAEQGPAQTTTSTEQQPEQPALHCTRCGRQQGDPQNDTCDMAPCPFA